MPEFGMAAHYLLRVCGKGLPAWSGWTMPLKIPVNVDFGMVWDDNIARGRLDGAAQRGRNRLGPEAHHHPDDLVALFEQQRGCDGAVDPAAHRDNDAFGHLPRTARTMP